MRSQDLDAIIESVGPMTRAALGEIHEGIIDAAAAKLHEASEKDADKIKLVVPMKLVVRLDRSPPAAYVHASVGKKWEGEGYPEGEEPDQPKSGAQRAREYRERQREGGNDD